MLNTGFHHHLLFLLSTFFACMHAKLLHLCLTLCDSMVCSPPGFSVHEDSPKNTGGGSIPSSKGSSQPRDWMRVSCVSRTGSWVLYYLRHLPSLPQAMFSSGLIHPIPFFFFCNQFNCLGLNITSLPNIDFFSFLFFFRQRNLTLWINR